MVGIDRGESYGSYDFFIVSTKLGKFKSNLFYSISSLDDLTSTGFIEDDNVFWSVIPELDSAWEAEPTTSGNFVLNNSNFKIGSEIVDFVPLGLSRNTSSSYYSDAVVKVEEQTFEVPM